MTGKQPGHDRREWLPHHPLFSPPSHFPFGSKRFMVPARFAFGEIEFMINIKGLASGLRLWRVV
jgi:hypothetical protein